MNKDKLFSDMVAFFMSNIRNLWRKFLPVSMGMAGIASPASSSQGSDEHDGRMRTVSFAYWGWDKNREGWIITKQELGLSVKLH